jgi:hypothetical protein
MRKFSLTSSAVAEGSFLLSLKLTQSISDLIERDESKGGDVAIEFVSATEGNLFVGDQCFRLHWLEGRPAEYYSFAHEEEGKCEEVGSEASLLGTSDVRFHVISSLETASRDLKKKQSQNKVNKSLAQVTKEDAVPNPISKANSTPIATAVQKSRKRAKPDDNVDHTSSVINTFEVGERPVKISTASSSSWMAIDDVPADITVDDVLNFFRGLKTKDVYVHYFYREQMDGSPSAVTNMDPVSEVALLAVIYIEFFTASGRDAALRRNGETLRITKGNSSNQQRRNMVRAALRDVDNYEASWAKATCIRLETPTVSKAVNARFQSQRLLAISPAERAGLWRKIVRKLPPPDEVCSSTQYGASSSMATLEFHSEVLFRGGTSTSTCSSGASQSYSSESTAVVCSNTGKGTALIPTSHESLRKNPNSEVTAAETNKVAVAAHAYLPSDELLGNMFYDKPLAETEEALSSLQSILSESFFQAMSKPSALAHLLPSDAQSSDARTHDRRTQWISWHVYDLASRMFSLYTYLYSDLKKKRFLYSKRVTLVKES